MIDGGSEGWLHSFLGSVDLQFLTAGPAWRRYIQWDVGASSSLARKFAARPEELEYQTGRIGIEGAGKPFYL